MKDQIEGLTSELERTNELIQKFARYIETFGKQKHGIK